MLVRVGKFQGQYDAVHTQNAVENYVDKISLEVTASFRKRAPHALASANRPGTLQPRLGQNAVQNCGKGLSTNLSTRSRPAVYH